MAHPQKKDRTSLADLLPHDFTAAPLQATTRKAAIKELLNAVVIQGVVPLDKERVVRETILEREEVAATGLGNGIAVPHGKNKFAERFGVAIGFSHDGIDFGARDGIPAFVVVLWACPPAATKQHLALMRGLAVVAKDANLAGKLAAATDRKTVLAVLSEVDADTK